MKAQIYDYDLIVIGGGAAGLTAAKTARGFGKSVAIIEKNKLGGECTWTGCVPSKALIASANIANTVAESKKFGIAAQRTSDDTRAVMDRVRSIVQEIYSTHTPEVLQELGITIINGIPMFVDPYTVHVAEQTIRARYFIIATGSHPFIPSIEGLNTISYFTNETFFNQEALPKRLIILGGGAVGSEMASACNQLGVAVTIIEKEARILPHEDAELVAMLSNRLQKKGVTILPHHTAYKVSEKNGIITLHCKKDTGEQVIVDGDALLVAVGRRPNMHGLGLEAIGVATDYHGIEVDRYLRSTVKNIFACGDVVGPYQFSHMAWYQAVTAVRNMCIPIFKQKIDPRIRLWATFTAPELARCGLTEQEALNTYGRGISVYTRSYDTLDRAHTDGTTFGMAKVICDSSDNIVGVHILGVHAVDMIHELHMMQMFHKKFSALHAIIHAYPSYAEILWHMSKKAYVQQLQKRWYIQLAKKLFGISA